MRRLCSRASRGLFVALFVVAFFAPAAYAELPTSVTISSAEPTVDVTVVLSEAATLVVMFDSGVPCAQFSHSQHLDPYLYLYTQNGQLLAADDDGNHNEQNCYGAKLFTELEAGTYVVRFSSYGSTTGTGQVSWSTGLGTPTTSAPDTTSSSTTSLSTTTVVSTTTTSSSTTTTSTTTTTLAPAPTTTSTSSSTTSSTTTAVPTTSTTLPPASTTVVPAPPTTSTTTSSTVVTTTTTTVPAWTTTTSSSSTTTSVVPPTSTTVALEQTTTSVSTLPTTTSTSPPSTTTSQPTTTSTSIVGSPTTTNLEPPTSQSSSTTTSSSTTSVPTVSMTTTSVSPPSSVPPEPNSWITSTTSPAPTSTTTTIEKQPDELTDELVAVLDGELTAEDVETLVAAGVDNIPPQYIDAVVDALNAAPDDVRADFEEQTNVFDGQFDDYVPVGSNVSVAERRTIVAITATVASPLSPVTAVRRRR